MGQGSRDDGGASFEARALSIAADYCWQRLHLRNVEIENLWRASRPGIEYKSTFLTKLRSDPASLPVEVLTQFRNIFRHVISLDHNKQKRLKNYDLIGDVFEKSGLSSALFGRVRDFRFKDADLLSILEPTPHVPLNQPDQLLELIGGFWHVVRRDTSKNPDEFNVSLLNVKPVIHFTQVDGSDDVEAVISTLPRFSLRSRGKNQGSVQEFRGAVVSLEGTVYFLATREDSSPRFVLMSWSMPSRRSAKIAHADVAEGVISTVNADARQIVGPVVAQFLDRDGDHSLTDRKYVNRHKDRITAGVEVDVTKEDQEEARFWHERTQEGGRRAKRYTRAQLDGLARFNPHMTVDDLVSRLEEKTATGVDGYFEL